MIAWNGVEKALINSSDIVENVDQNESFFLNLKPLGKCELGTSNKYQLKLLNIKI